MKKIIQIITSVFTKHKEIEDTEQMRDFKSEYEKEIREAKGNVVGNKMKIEEMGKEIKVLEKEMDRYAKANDYLEKLTSDYEKKLAELNDPVCHCWSCEYASSKGWFPADLTEEQNKEIRQYGIEKGLI